MDPDIHDEVRRVSDKVVDLELSTTKKLGEIETSVRLSKHEGANTQQIIVGLTARMDRFETSFKSEMKDFREDVGKEFRQIATQLTADVKGLSQELATINTKQEKGLSFVAGVVAVFTVGGGLLLMLGKVLFGGSG